ncbi:alpha/beta-hydrolase [Crepidotus variabilis]|uniref:Alpha/beta-hydrolase n=1 Tax=Crepidotus variabilis TaxID=179855 RepID=A0A9P6JIG7_9AGAR|nr:alpha/beta-hydrolase [Crepidotus variabilis]
MHLSSFFVALFCVFGSFATPISFPKRAVSNDVFNDLVFYFKYASSSYSLLPCGNPNGNTLVKQITNAKTDTQGFIARDDTRKEVIVAFRGSSSAQDFQTDADTRLIAFNSPGVNAPAGTLVHSGFLTAYNSVAADIISTVQSELAANPGYAIVTSGHSLGGGLSSISASSLKSNFPNTTVQMYTYGQPRTGNAAYADLINSQFGSNAFRGRSSHSVSPVPTIIPTTLGYRHHGVEFFQNPDPPSAQTTKQCDPSGEDPTCSAAIPSGGINAAHLTYFGIPASTRFCN